MSATPPPVAASRPFSKSGFLIAMLLGAGVGALVARTVEQSAGGADPEFVSILGAAFGGILGRSIWMRVHRAREAGRAAAPPVLLLVARTVLCALVALALFGPDRGPTAGWGTTVRTVVAIAGIVAFSLVGVLEYRWMRQPATSGGARVD